VLHQETDVGDHHSILKRDGTHLESRSESHSILKKDSVQLKKEGIQMSGSTESTHSILKKESPPYDLRQEIRGILKKDSSFESKTEPEKSVLRKRGSGGEELLHDVVRKRGSGGEELLHDVEVDNGKTDLNANNQTVDSESVIKRTEAAVTERGKLKKTSSFGMHLEHPDKSVKKNEEEIKTDQSSLSLKNDLEKSQTEASKVSHAKLNTKSVTKITKDTEELVTKDTPSKDTVTPVLESRVRSRVKSDDDVTRTPVSMDSTPRLSSNLSRSRSARVTGRDSSTDDDSSTSSEKMSWIKNDAVARRRFRNLEDK
jgi:hypothetical protein